MKKPILELIDVWKIYKLDSIEVPAIRGINLTIREKEFISIMGPSGSGKSTLLHLMGCLDFPTKGKVLLKGKDITKLSEDELAKIRGKTIGFIFQAFNLLPEFTALENVMFPMTFQGIDEKKRKERALKLLASVGLLDRANHKPNQMSGGERQRVAIARALANNPELILADEPTGNLDSQTGKQIMDILVQLHKNENKTIIVVTHDPEIAKYTKEEKIYFLKDGKFVQNHKRSKDVLWKEVRK